MTLITRAQNKANERAEAIDQLRTMLPPGTTVYTLLRHVSASGMSRDIDLYVMLDNEPRWISGLVRRAIGGSEAKDGSIRVGGCGMDMGFATVYSLSRVLYPDGFACLGRHEGSFRSCPSNDHSNYRRDDPDLPTHHKDGGYALKHRWM